MSNTKSTEIASLGEFGLIDRLTSRLKKRNKSTLLSAGDDAAVIDCGKDAGEGALYFLTQPEGVTTAYNNFNLSKFSGAFFSDTAS